MAVAYDAVGPDATGGSTTLGTLGWTHVCGAAATLLIVDVSVGEDTPPDTGITTTATYNSISPTMTVSDPGSNTWNTDQDIAAGTSGHTYQLSCVVTTALDSGDTITVTSSQTVVHFACVLEEFNDIMTGTDVGATGNSGGSSDATPSTSATATTAQPNELLVGVMGLVSPLRVYTPGSGFTVGSHINSTAASSDRGVVMQWKYLTATGTYVSNGTFNSASIYGATVQAYKITFRLLAG